MHFLYNSISSECLPYEDGEIEDISLSKSSIKPITEPITGSTNARNVPGTVRKIPNVLPAKNIPTKLDDNSDYTYANGNAGGIGQIQTPTVGLSNVGGGTNRGGPESTGIPFKLAGPPSNGPAVTGSASNRPSVATVNISPSIFFFFR